MHELLPIVAGLALGASMRYLPSAIRAPVIASLVVAIAVLAFVLSGEVLLSWGFLIIDLGGTALAVATGNVAAQSLSERGSRVRKRHHPGAESRE